jgi:hypothetical protein
LTILKTFPGVACRGAAKPNYNPHNKKNKERKIGRDNMKEPEDAEQGEKQLG